MYLRKMILETSLKSGMEKAGTETEKMEFLTCVGEPEVGELFICPDQVHLHTYYPTYELVTEAS